MLNWDKFFSNSSDYVHTLDVFETADLVYVHYQLQLEDYVHIYDKTTKKHINISAFTNNKVGWLGTPDATYRDWMVNVVSPFDIQEAGIQPEEELNNVLEGAEGAGNPILVFTQFHLE